MKSTHTADYRPAQWAADHASLDNAAVVALPLDALRAAGPDQQVADLSARNPAAHVRLDDPGDVAWLLNALRAAGADQQVTDLTARGAAHARPDDPAGVVSLLNTMRDMGAKQQAESWWIDCPSKASLASSSSNLDT